jgi:ribonucleotide reductase alpha subunit
MRFQRLFTAGHPDDVYAPFEFESRTSEIRDPDGKLVFRLENFLVPVHWSRTASDILSQHYFRRAGIPSHTRPVPENGLPDWLARCEPDTSVSTLVFGGEADARQVFRRLAGCWTYWGWKGGYFSTEDDARVFFDEVRWMLCAQMMAPNSPQFYNTGVYWSYGIKGNKGEGYWYVDDADPTKDGKILVRDDAYMYERPSSLACFIQTLNDNLLGENGIMDWLTREARVFRVGAGSGVACDEIRGAGEPLSAGGTSSGLLSFLKPADASGGALKSGGTTRRCARLLCLKMDHPEIEDFIDWKVKEQNKVAAIAAGSKLQVRHFRLMHAAAQVPVFPKSDVKDISVSPWVTDPKENPVLADACRQAVAEGIPPHQVANFLNRLKTAKSAMEAVAMCLDEYDIDWQGEAYRTVSGQNANNSVRPIDEFMRLAITGQDKPDADDWPIYWRTELRKAEAENRKPVPHRMTSAASLWRRVNDAAWWCADPGVQFDTTIQEWNPTPKAGKIEASNPCQPGFATVLTPDGIRTFNDIDVGSVIWSGKKWTKVVAKVATGRKQVYRFSTRSGSFIGTADHTVFQCGVRVKAGDAQSIDFADGPPTDVAAIDQRDVMDGLVVGDGSVVYANRGANNYQLLCIGANDQDYFTEPGLAELITETPFDRLRHRVLTTLSGQEMPPLPERSIPDRHHCGSQSKVCGFLRGLYSANGSVCGGRVTLKTTSIRLVWQVQEMLSSLGIPSYYTKNESKDVTFSNGTYRCKQSYDINITHGRKDFRRLIGFIHKDKQTRLDDACSMSVRPWNKRAYEVVEKVSLGEFDVYDITVDAPEHSYWTGGMLVSNCSEFMYINDTGCNLLSLNVIRFRRPRGKMPSWYKSGWSPAVPPGEFDADAYTHAGRLCTLILEITCSMGQFPSREIARNTWKYRPLGIGYCNVGALIACNGYAYDSAEGRALAASLMALLHFTGYATSAEIAGDIGSCQGFRENRDDFLRVVRNHLRAAGVVTTPYEGLSKEPMLLERNLVPENILAAVDDQGSRMLSWGEQTGYRNCQISVCAPTGCLVAGSLILTNKGLLPISSLGNTEGDQWQDVDFRVQTDSVPQKATKFYVNGLASVWQLQTARGYALRGTGHHQVKVVDNETKEWIWKRFDQIREDDKIPMRIGGMLGSPAVVILPPTPAEYRVNVGRGVTTPEKMTTDLAFLVGMFAANGSSHDRGLRFAICGLDEDTQRATRSLLETTFGVEAYSTVRGKYVEIGINSRQLVRWWSECGFAKAAKSDGTTGKGRICSIPMNVLKTNDRTIYSSYLGGLFSGDGSVNAGKPYWTNKSLDFVQSIQTMLMAVGIPFCMDEQVGGISKKPVYRLRTVNAIWAVKFRSEIGFVNCERKQSILVKEGDTKLEKKDYILVPKPIIDKVCPVGHPRRKLVILNLWREGGLPRSLAMELAAESGDETLTRLTDYYYDSVSECAMGDAEPTYDLSVPDNVTYIANGMVSHNTISLLMDADCSGIEPDFALVKFKKLAGGGYFRLVNGSVEEALVSLGYSAQEADRYVKHMAGHGKLPDGMVTSGLVPAEVAAKAEAACKSCFHVRMAFTSGVVGEHVFADAVSKMSDEQRPKVGRTGSLIDGYLAPDQVEDVNNYVCGVGHLEGVLPEKHLAVFDCANPCGRTGKRFVSPEGHVYMLGAIAPFLSGSSSKTVNCPAGVTPDDMRQWNELAWRLSVKAVAQYRDGSKLSQPLSSGIDDALSLPEKVERVAEAMATRVGGRQKLPDRRLGYTQKARINNNKIYLRTGEYKDGTIGEIFLDMHKEGAEYRAMVNQFAIAVSLGLQYGVPLEEFVDAFVGVRFNPSGLVSGNQHIKMTSSLVDYIFRDLAISYLGRFDLANVPPDAISQTVETQANGPAVPPSQSQVSVAKGYTGSACARCGNFTLIRNGPCTKCDTCGDSTGC